MYAYTLESTFICADTWPSGRKRKVKCQLTEENVETCAECVKSETRCSLQAPEIDRSSGSSPPRADEQERELRLKRIESLLQKLVEAQERSQPPEGSSGSDPTTFDSFWNDTVRISREFNGKSTY